MSGTALTAEEEARIKERHRPVELSASTHRPKPVWCTTCGSLDSPWPCDAARLLLSFAAVEAAVQSATDPVGLAAVRKALSDRRDDLSWCNKDDDCHVGASWYDLALSDFDSATASLLEDSSPLGHGTPVPEEATLPSGDARVAAL